MATRKTQNDNTVINTTALNEELAQKVAKLQIKNRQLSEYYKNEKKVAVQGSPMYRPYFGNNMPIILNGIAIYVPLDGQQYEIPESFAAIFFDRISRIDEQINMRKRMSNVQENSEAYAGERDLIRRV